MIDQAKKLAKEIRFQDDEEIPNTNIFRVGADMIDALCAEIERLKHIEAALNEWLQKTEWVQDSAEVRELGMHRADVLKQRIERLRGQKQFVEGSYAKPSRVYDITGAEPPPPNSGFARLGEFE